MYPAETALLLALVALIWLGGLTYSVWKDRKFVGELFPRGKEDKQTAADLLQKRFKELLDAIEDVKERENALNRNFKELAKDGLRHIQKVAILRYNPYGDTGGDQSFSVVLLDGRFDGFILTSLHSRAGTRVYTKPVKSGKAVIELSKEEGEVLKKALDA